MKKLLALLVVLAMIIGCGGNSATTPTSVVNSIDQALCNPSAAVIADANAVAAFLQSGLSAAAAIYPPAAPVSGISVAGIFTTVQKGGCVFAEDLKAALAWFDSLGITGKAAKPPATALRAWLGK